MLFKLINLIFFLNVIKLAFQLDQKTNEYLLVANNSAIYKLDELNLSSSLITYLPGDHRVKSFDYSFREKLIFWLSNLDKSIYVHNIETGRKVNSLFKYQKGFPEYLTIDWLTKKIYYIQNEPIRIEVSDYDGTNNSLILLLIDETPKSIAVAPLSGLLFWNNNEKGTISRISMNGDESTRKIIINDTKVYAMSVDHNLKKIYWTDTMAKRVRSCNFNGQYQRYIISTFTPTLAFFNGNIYYSDFVQGSVYSIDTIQQTKKRELIKFNNSLPPLLSFFSNQNQPDKSSECLTNNGGCSNLCLLSSEPPYYSCSCPTGIQLLSDNKTCKTFPDAFLLIAFRNEIKYISLDTNHFLPKLTKIKNQEKITSVGFDPFEQRIYWTDKNRLKSAFLNGSDDRLITECDLEYERLKIDTINRNIYLVKSAIIKNQQQLKEYSSNFSIEVVSLDGRFKKTLIDDFILKPRAIAIDEQNEFFYWSDWAENKAKIEKVSFDLRVRNIIINDLIWPNGIVIENELNRLYWCDSKKYWIEYSSLDGSNRQILVKLDAYILDLTLLGDHIYWSEKNKDQIGRVHKITGKYEVLSNKDQKLGKIMGISANILSVDYQFNQKRIINKRSCSQLSLSENLCACSDGFQLQDDNKTCILGVNTCNLNNGDCDQNCVQIIGNYRKCSCHFGHVLDDDQKSCKIILPLLPLPSCDNLANNPCSHGCVQIGEDFHCKCPDEMFLNKEGKTCLSINMNPVPIMVKPVPEKEKPLILPNIIIILIVLSTILISSLIVKYYLLKIREKKIKFKGNSVRQLGSGKSISNIVCSNGLGSRSTSILAQRQNRLPEISPSSLDSSSTKFDDTNTSISIDQNCFNYEIDTDITNTFYVPPPTPFTPLKQKFDEIRQDKDNEYKFNFNTNFHYNSPNEYEFNEESFIINKNDGLRFKLANTLDQIYCPRFDPPNSRNHSPTPLDSVSD